MLLALPDGYRTVVYVYSPQRGEGILPLRENSHRPLPVLYLHGVQSHPAWFAGRLNLVIRAGEGSEQLGFRRLGELLEQAGKKIGREVRRNE